jgi:hypothetical protein
MVSLRIEEIVSSVASGRLALPQFQRPFVWDPNAVLELIDSLVHGWPIGSFLLLEGPQPFALRQFRGGPPIDNDSRADSKVERFVLDGQQRITSLYHVFTDTGDVEYMLNLDQDLHPEQAPITWRKRSGARLPHNHILMSLALNDRAFEAHLVEVDAGSRADFIEARELRLGSLLEEQLTIPSIQLDRQIDLEALTRIFETLNRTGTPLDAFDLMVALLYPQGFYLGDELERAQKDFPNLVEFETPGLELLKLVALFQRQAEREDEKRGIVRPVEKRVRGVRQRDVLNTPVPFVVAEWPRAVREYSSALEWLRVFGGVSDSASIPSRAMLLTLAYSLGSKVGQQTILDWYWTNIALQTYAQGANTQVTSDVDGLQLPPEQASSTWTESLVGALLDESRRNRVLRLGLRGLAVRAGFLDAFDGKPLQGAVRDISLVQLLNRKVAAPGNEPLVDRVFVSDVNVAKLRSRLASGDSLSELLNNPALIEQGAHAYLDTDADVQEVRLARTRFILQRIEGTR